MDSINIRYIDKLLNTYVFLEDYDRELIILSYNIDIKHNFDYDDFINDIKASELYIENILIKDKSINFVFKIPDKYIDDYNLFTTGKYSKINKGTKMLILNTLTDKYGLTHGSKTLHKVRDVLYCGEDLRKELEAEFNMVIPKDWELSSIINTEDETFKMVYEE
jgi:hypothetical protein